MTLSPRPLPARAQDSPPQSFSIAGLPRAVAEGEAARGGGENGATALRKTLLRISVHAFCEDRKTAEVLQAAERLLAKARIEVSTGGLDAAVARYGESPFPDLIVVETTLPSAQMLAGLDRLAAFCRPTAKVIVIGRINDIALYRELLKRGIGEYLVAPVLPTQFIDAAASLFDNPGAEPSRLIAFVGAKGGVGSSTVCHNVAWTMSEITRSHVVVVDLDLAFGTTGLNFNQDPTKGIAEALKASGRLDKALLDRLLTKCSQHLSILAAPVTLEPEYDISADACDVVLNALRQYVPFVVVDLPHAWAPAVKEVLLQADDIVVTAAPDLANLRNAKNLVDLLGSTRSSGAAPHLVINMAKTPKRPDIAIKEFSLALDLDPAQVIEFDGETFGLAANNGQMIEEFSRKAKSAKQFRALALTLAHGVQPTEAKKPSPLAPILERLKLTI